MMTVREAILLTDLNNVTVHAEKRTFLKNARAHVIDHSAAYTFILSRHNHPCLLNC